MGMKKEPEAWNEKLHLGSTVCEKQCFLYLVWPKSNKFKAQIYENRLYNLQCSGFFFFFYLVINLFFQFLQPDVTLLLTGLGSRNSVPL